MRGFAVGVLMVLLVATGAGAASIKLVTNPDFDDAEGISGWIGSSGDWDMNLDVDAEPDSGSVRIIDVLALTTLAVIAILVRKRTRSRPQSGAMMPQSKLDCHIASYRWYGKCRLFLLSARHRRPPAVSRPFFVVHVSVHDSLPQERTR